MAGNSASGWWRRACDGGVGGRLATGPGSGPGPALRLQAGVERGASKAAAGAAARSATRRRDRAGVWRPESRDRGCVVMGSMVLYMSTDCNRIVAAPVPYPTRGRGSADVPADAWVWRGLGVGLGCVAGRQTLTGFPARTPESASPTGRGEEAAALFGKRGGRVCDPSVEP